MKKLYVALVGISEALQSTINHKVKKVQLATVKRFRDGSFEALIDRKIYVSENV